MFKGYIQRSLHCRAYCNLAVDLAIQDIWCLVEGCSGLTESFLRVNLYSVLKVFKDLFGLSFGGPCLLEIEVSLGRGFSVLYSFITAVLCLSRKTSHIVRWSPRQPSLALSAGNSDSLAPLEQNRQIIYTRPLEDADKMLVLL